MQSWLVAIIVVVIVVVAVAVVTSSVLASRRTPDLYTFKAVSPAEYRENLLSVGFDPAKAPDYKTVTRFNTVAASFANKVASGRASQKDVETLTRMKRNIDTQYPEFFPKMEEIHAASLQRILL